jgi:linoleate 10R-lipoxygenase
MSMIFNDYVAGFLGNTRNGQSWHMQPFNQIYTVDGTEVGRGQGNHVSVEFNLLYRWHATVGESDEQWTAKMISNIFGTSDFEKITVADFIKVAQAPNSPLFQDDDPKTRDYFPGRTLKRGPDGRYNDNDLAKIIQDATEEPAHRYGARATPPALRIIEILTILQGRSWGVCTMNEFRQCMGLKKFDSFEEWNNDPAIANAARLLYQHIDRLELYPGLQAEQILELHYGSGFCCGYTTMRAILADAISLVRGDRFYTTDFTPGNLTSWGFNDVQAIDDNGGFGACLPKLLLRHLPNNYTWNSVYGLFPFFTPGAMKANLTKLGIVDKYDLSKPKPGPSVVAVETLRGIRSVFNDFERFKVTYTADMKVGCCSFDLSVLH